MGVGYPVDLVVSSCLGADMYDCVFPTRTARQNSAIECLPNIFRFGTALTKHGFMRLNKAEHATDLRPIQDDCSCTVLNV